MDDDLLPDSLKFPELPVRLDVAQGKSVNEITEVWNTLDNEMHPGLRLTVTIALEPMAAEIATQVSTTEFGFWQTPSPDAIAAAPEDAPPQPAKSINSFMVNGKIISEKYSTAVLKLVVNETGREVDLSEEGIFSIPRLREGEYHLNILANDRLLKRQKIIVPSPNYEFQV